MCIRDSMSGQQNGALAGSDDGVQLFPADHLVGGGGLTGTSQPGPVNEDPAERQNIPEGVDPSPQARVSGKAFFQIGPGLPMNLPAEKDMGEDDQDQQERGPSPSEEAQDQIKDGMSEEFEALFNIPETAGGRWVAGDRISHLVFSSG
jgi:hypothetical protein